MVEVPGLVMGKVEGDSGGKGGGGREGVSGEHQADLGPCDEGPGGACLGVAAVDALMPRRDVDALREDPDLDRGGAVGVKGGRRALRGAGQTGRRRRGSGGGGEEPVGGVQKVELGNGAGVLGEQVLEAGLVG